jgi:hypothetical protein
MNENLVLCTDAYCIALTKTCGLSWWLDVALQRNMDFPHIHKHLRMQAMLLACVSLSLFQRLFIRRNAAELTYELKMLAHRFVLIE